MLRAVVDCATVATGDPVAVDHIDHFDHDIRGGLGAIVDRPYRVDRRVGDFGLILQRVVAVHRGPVAHVQAGEEARGVDQNVAVPTGGPVGQVLAAPVHLVEVEGALGAHQDVGDGVGPLHKGDRRRGQIGRRPRSSDQPIAPGPAGVVHVHRIDAARNGVAHAAEQHVLGLVAAEVGSLPVATRLVEEPGIRLLEHFVCGQ